ncbi:MAG: hypothetical protein H0W64_11945 [Gammaproteobacteria bacterium]|nr:hypothetical protein [Gammaproteobacteria bacterium]
MSIVLSSSEICQQFLNQLKVDLSVIKRAGRPVSETQGEVLFQSVNSLIKIMNLSSADHFLDLGSALGKVVLQVFMLTEVQNATGIEIVPECAAFARRMKNSLQECHPLLLQGRHLDFIEGDFFREPFNEATVIWINAICFTPMMLKHLSQMLNQMNSVRMVLTLRPLLNLSKLRFERTIMIEGSWDSALCYVYRACNLFKTKKFDFSLNIEKRK